MKDDDKSLGITTELDTFIIALYLLITFYKKIYKKCVEIFANLDFRTHLA